MNLQTAKLMAEAISYDEGDTARIQHFIKVHDLAVTIGTLEDLDEKTMRILETAAILHDIGIHKSEEKYGSGAGHFQEIEGPPEAEGILKNLGGYGDDEIERVKFLIGHHHTYSDTQGMDYQILIEADFLVNLYEEGSGLEAVETARNRIFKTKTGLKFLNEMFK